MPVILAPLGSQAVVVGHRAVAEAALVVPVRSVMALRGHAGQMGQVAVVLVVMAALVASASTTFGGAIPEKAGEAVMVSLGALVHRAQAPLAP